MNRATVYREPERKIRGYKTTCRKCETEEDLKDMIRLASENINGASRSGNAEVYGNQIYKPEELLTNPDRIADQLIDEQRCILGEEKSRSRRVNIATYMIDEKKYNINKEDGVKLAQGLLDTYSEYSSIVTLTERKGILRIDHISSNLCENGLRMTQVFKPNTLYNLYRNLKGDK